MNYRLSGRLCGLICAERPEALAKVKVRLTAAADNKNATASAVANPKDTFTIRT
jgi:hypothetical protein